MAVGNGASCFGGWLMRRTATITIETEGRDKGAVFTITEMPAVQATDWFLRAMQLLIRSGADVPPNIMLHGPAAFVTMGIGTVLGGLGKAPWPEFKALMDELMGCLVSYQPVGAVQPVTNPALILTQIEEVATLLYIREEVVSMHLNFSIRERLSNYRQLAAQMMVAIMQTTETSTGGSAPSSEDGSPEPA
jgi:hypothetical protein